MSVRPYKNNKERWIIDITLGRKKRLREVFNGSYEEAIIYEQELKKHLSAKTNKTLRNISEIAIEYLEHVKIHQSEQTYRNKHRMLLKHILPFFHAFSLDMINPRLIMPTKLRGSRR